METVEKLLGNGGKWHTALRKERLCRFSLQTTAMWNQLQTSWGLITRNSWDFITESTEARDQFLCVHPDFSIWNSGDCQECPDSCMVLDKMCAVNSFWWLFRYTEGDLEMCFWLVRICIRVKAHWKSCKMGTRSWMKHMNEGLLGRIWPSTA